MDFRVNIKDIKYVKMFSLQKEDYFLRTYLREITDTRIVLYVKHSEDYNENFSAEEDVNLSFICEDGLYSTKTKLSNVFVEIPYVVFMLEKPKNIEYEQNREFFRVNAKFECEYRWDSENGTKTFQTKTNNISANGINIYIPNENYIPQICDMTIDVNGKKAILVAQFVRKEAVLGGYNVAYKYIDIKEHYQDMISQACIRLQIEKRKHLL